MVKKDQLKRKRKKDDDVEDEEVVQVDASPSENEEEGDYSRSSRKRTKTESVTSPRASTSTTTSPVKPKATPKRKRRSSFTKKKSTRERKKKKSFLKTEESDSHDDTPVTEPQNEVDFDVKEEDLLSEDCDAEVAHAFDEDELEIESSTSKSNTRETRASTKASTTASASASSSSIRPSNSSAMPSKPRKRGRKSFAELAALRVNSPSSSVGTTEAIRSPKKPEVPSNRSLSPPLSLDTVFEDTEWDEKTWKKVTEYAKSIEQSVLTPLKNEISVSKGGSKVSITFSFF